MTVPTRTGEKDQTSRAPGVVELNQNGLAFRFPEVHEDARFSLAFQRTLRIPDNGREHFLPPGLGRFPLELVDDYADRVPEAWREHGGVFLPMYQAEAMWINFHGEYPMAVKVAAGKVNALTGEEWSEDLCQEPQDYLVVPDQPWLDGFSVKRGLIRQFVAMRLGEGYTAEEQLTGEARHGGVQITVYPMKASEYEKRNGGADGIGYVGPVYCMAVSAPPTEMGLAPGGLMRQEIYSDEYGFDVWDTTAGASCYVHIVNSLQYFSVCGVSPPHRTPTAEEYAEAGLPWFDYYDADLKALAGAEKLAGLDSVSGRRVKEGRVVRQEGPLGPVVVQPLSPDDLLGVN
ncbi:MAG: hypothetical protein OXI56_03670 [bacterium]|nr:hypothetical protein [bacterium]MDE0600877.1 hypothetical protein [bacterium]